MKIIASKNRAHALSFIAPLNIYSSVKETEQESIFSVFVFLWSHPTRVGRIGSRVGWGGAGELGRQAGYGVGPQGALLSREKVKRKDGDKRSSISCRRRRCSQKLDEMGKNGNCSYPVGEKTERHGVARQAVTASKNSNII